RWALAPVVDSIPQTSALNQQDIILRPWRRKADVIHFGFVAVAQAGKAQAVGLRVDQSGQLCLEQSVLRGVQDALVYGILHALAVIETSLCNLAQPAPSGCWFGVDVVGDQSQHRRSPYFQKKGG